jgi:ferredoxin
MFKLNRRLSTNIKTITIKFIEKATNHIHEVKAPIGMNILEVAHTNNIDLEGACECALACSTCHVIIKDPAFYDKLAKPEEAELDMLDLAYDLTDYSRLGCQIIATPDLDMMELILPSGTRNYKNSEP